MIRRSRSSLWTVWAWALWFSLCLSSCTDTKARDKAEKQRALTIQRFDLSAETARRSIVDREPGVYLGHPSTVLLDDGRTLLVAYPQGHGAGPIRLKKSFDGGRTWSARLSTPASFETSKETPTLFRLPTKQGKKRILLFSGRRREFTLTPIRMAHSDDDGATFTELAPIGDFGGIVAMASMLTRKDGEWLAYFHDDRNLWDLSAQKAGTQSVILETRSHDDGLTWQKPRIIASDPTIYLCEPFALRSPDQHEIAMLMRDRDRKHGAQVMFSRDDGEHWDKPRPLPKTLSGDRHVAKYARDGRLLVVFRDTHKGSPTHGDFVLWVGRYDDIQKSRQGQYLVRLLDNKKGTDCGYAGLEVLADDTIVATTYGHVTRGEEPYVISIRLTLAELDQRAKKGASAAE